MTLFKRQKLKRHLLFNCLFFHNLLQILDLLCIQDNKCLAAEILRIPEYKWDMALFVESLTVLVTVALILSGSAISVCSLNKFDSIGIDE